MVEGGHPSRLWPAAGSLLLMTAAYYGVRSVASQVVFTDFGTSPDSFARQALGYSSMATMLFVPLGGLVADKWLGLRRSLMTGSALLAAGIILCIARRPEFLLVGGLLVVLAEGLFRYNIYVYLGEAYPKLAPVRVGGFVVLSIASSLGSLVSGLAANFVAGTFGMSIGFAVCALPAILSFVILLVIPEEQRLEASSPTPATPTVFGPQLKALAILAGIFILIEAAYSAVGFAAYPRDFGSYSTRWMYSLIFSIAPIVTLVLGVIAAVFWSGGTLSSYSDRIGPVLAIGCALVAMAAVSTTLIPGEQGVGMGGALGAHALIGASEVLIFPVLYAAVTALAPLPWRATAVGIFALSGIGSWLPLAKLAPTDAGSHALLGGVLVLLLAIAAGVGLFTKGRVEEALELSNTDPGPVSDGGAAVQAAAPAAGSATTDLIAGGVALTIGLVVTIGSLSTSSATGGYVITTGLIVFGIVRLIRGFQKLGS